MDPGGPERDVPLPLPCRRRSFIPLVPPPAAELAHSAAPPLPHKVMDFAGAHLHPSMKVDRRYFCFGCGATGDVIDFVSRLEGISPKEAALPAGAGLLRPP